MGACAETVAVGGTKRGYPLVSVVVPVFNEERWIERCLQSILTQDYPPQLMEVLVVDGMSTDSTRDIVTRVAREDDRVRLLDNPRRRQPYAMNIGIQAARGEVIVRVDGHGTVTTGHVRRCVEYLLSTGAEHVGGVSRATGTSYVGRAIALALTSPFGVGSARFRYTDQEGQVDHVPWGAYRRDTFTRVGLFDERFLIGEDTELDFRINRAGGTVRLSPEIVTDYYCRASFPALARQYFSYGMARIRMVRKHGGLPSLRVLFPASFVCSFFLLATLSLIIPLAPAVLALTALYAVAAVGASLPLAARSGWRYLPLLPLAFLTLHLSHGCGFLSGLVRPLASGRVPLPEEIPSAA